MAPKVSFVTCSHNRPALLRKAIESLQAQTDPDWEQLIYDDASTDKGVAGVLEWALRDPRIRVWRGQENLDRPSVLWNFMMDRAHGRYLTVLDDDNEKISTFVEKMAGELDADPGLGVITCGWRVDRPSGGPEGNYFLNMATNAVRLAEMSTCDGGAMLYRRETFEHAGYFSEDIRTNEDWDWLRRAFNVGKVKNLNEAHATYRSHDGSRMVRGDALGNAVDIAKVKSRHLSGVLGVRAVYPPFDRLTASQRDVCTGVKDGLADIRWVAGGTDVCLVVSPFPKSDSEIAIDAKGCGKILSLHMEDPYALSTNLERVRGMSKLAETWVCTNDAATVGHYQRVVGNRVIVCPLLSANPTFGVNIERDIDVLLCGYAYPSRKRFVTALLPKLRGLRIVLAGDGWERGSYGVYPKLLVLPTQGLADTYRLHARAKAVVCLHRVRGDCTDGPVEPISVNRGFMEGYSGARVFIDQSRPYHSLDEGDVVWYKGAEDLAGALKTYLAGAPSIGFAEKCRALYTYRARLARILNCVRAPRFLAEIP